MLIFTQCSHQEELFSDKSKFAFNAGSVLDRFYRNYFKLYTLKIVKADDICYVICSSGSLIYK